VRIGKKTSSPRLNLGAAARVLFCLLQGATLSAAVRGDPSEFPEAMSASALAWSAAPAWEAFVDVASRAPIGDPLGRVWMFREDRPGQISRWDGREWLHIDVPFDTEKISRTLADDRGHILVQRYSAPKGVYDVGPEGATHYENLRQPILARVQAGARRFTSRETLGPIVTDDGRIWWAYAGSETVYAYVDGGWADLRLGEMRSIMAGEDGRPQFLVHGSLWEYRNGRLLRLAEKAGRGPSTDLCVDGFAARPRALPFMPGLPASFRRNHLVFKRVEPRGYIPISWREADRIAEGKPWEPPQWAEEVHLKSPQRSFSDGSGGFWITDSGNAVYRWFGGFLIPLKTRGTALEGATWLDLGADPQGGLWIVGRREETKKHSLLIRSAPAPRVRITGGGVRGSGGGILLFP